LKGESFDKWKEVQKDAFEGEIAMEMSLENAPNIKVINLKFPFPFYGTGLRSIAVSNEGK